MNIPITGILLIPLGLIVSVLPWRYCLVALMAFAMMSPAAVINVGSFGLQPGYYLSILLICRTAIEITLNGLRLDGFLLTRLTPLFYILTLCFIVLFIALCFFQGINTLPGSSGFKSLAIEPFHFARENLTQVAYLILNIVLVYTLGHQGGARDARTALKDYDTAVVCGLCFAAGICLWQFVSLYMALPFPKSFFYSNPNNALGNGQPMYGFFRINGPFEEPSTLGYTFTGYLLFAWTRYRIHPTAASIFMIAASIFCMLVSTSTTAFFGLFLAGCLFTYDVAAGHSSLMRRNSKFTSGQFFAIGMIVIFLLVAAIVVADRWESVYRVLQDTLFNKAETESFQERSLAELMALDIFTQTYGIGIGLGSHKADSLVLTLLSNTGIVGTALFFFFVYTVLRLNFGGLNREAAESMKLLVSPFQRALMGLIAIHVVANPNLSTLTLWVQIGCLLGLQAAARSSAQKQHVARRRFSDPRLAMASDVGR